MNEIATSTTFEVCDVGELRVRDGREWIGPYATGEQALAAAAEFVAREEAG